MKNSSRLFVTALIVLTGLVSCDLNPLPDNNDYDPMYEGPGGGNNGRFYAINISTNRFYPVYAEKLWDKTDRATTKCTIWAEKDSGGVPKVSRETARNIANTYDNFVYPKITGAFGTENFEFAGYTFSDIMYFSSWLVNGDGTLTILLLDIRDGSTGGSWTDGYFWDGDFIRNEPEDPVYRYSNFCNMIYIDIFPGTPGGDESNKTLAHELQHLINFVTSVLKRSTINAQNQAIPRQMDLWINEGLSAAAEYVFDGKHNAGRINWFNGDEYYGPNQNLLLGDNFYVWGNYARSDPDSLLNDYATVYLFFQWLRVQSGGISNEKNIYKDIIRSPFSDYRSVLSAAHNHVNTKYGDDKWGLLLRDWMAANYINASSGIYGYGTDTALRRVQAMVTTNLPSTYRLALAPGEGIYTFNATMDGVTSSTNIKLAGLRKNPAEVSDTQTYGVLLSYNVDINTKGFPSYCYPFSDGISEVARAMSGGDASVRTNQGNGEAARSLFRQPQLPRVPYPISAGDMLRLNGHEGGLPSLDFGKLMEQAGVNE